MQFDNIGNTYFERGELDKALRAFGDALHVFKLSVIGTAKRRAWAISACCTGAEVRRWKPLIIWRRPEPSIGTQGIGGAGG